MTAQLAATKGKIALDCSGCGDPFEVWRHRSSSAKFCSRACANQHMPSTWTADRASSGTRVTLTCKLCLEDFQVAPYRAARGATYCSRICKDADKSREVRTCFCTDTFTVYPSSSQKFCSRSCFYASEVRSSQAELSLKPHLEPLGFLNNGDRPLYFTGKGRVRVPDYVNTEDRKIIEVFGEYWHRDRVLPEGKTHETPEECVQWYKDLGWNCQVVWVKDLDSFKDSLSSERVS